MSTKSPRKNPQKNTKAHFAEIIPPDKIKLIVKLCKDQEIRLDECVLKFQRWCRDSVDALGNMSDVCLSKYYTKPPTLFMQLVAPLLKDEKTMPGSMSLEPMMELCDAIINKKRPVCEDAATNKLIEEFFEKNKLDVQGEYGGMQMNTIAQLWYGLPLAKFYCDAKESGDEDAFLKVMSVDPTFQREPWVSEKIDKARLAANYSFLNKLGRAVTPSKRKRVSKNSKITYALFMLMQLGYADKMTNAQIAEFLSSKGVQVDVTANGVKKHIQWLVKNLAD